MDDHKAVEELILEISLQLFEINQRIATIAELIEQKKSTPSPDSNNVPF